MISALNSSAVRLDEKKQTSLYDTPLRELFEEARKVAEERFKKPKPELETDEKKETKTTQQDDEAWDEWIKLKEFTKEKVKEEIKTKLAQNTVALNANPLNAGSEKANDTLSNDTQASANSANNAQASSVYSAVQNSRPNDELQSLLAMMI